MLKAKPAKRWARPTSIHNRPGKPGYLPISKATFWRRVHEGTIDVVTLGGVRLCDLDAIDAALERAKAAA